MNIQTPVNEVRNLRFDQFSSQESLAKATEQARKRNYQDFLIVDVDSHHYESESYSEIFKYIESPVLRRQAIESSARGGRSSMFHTTRLSPGRLPAGRSATRRPAASKTSSFSGP